MSENPSVDAQTDPVFLKSYKIRHISAYEMSSTNQKQPSDVDLSHLCCWAEESQRKKTFLNILNIVIIRAGSQLEQL